MRSIFTHRWRALTRGSPGHRFEDRYEAARKARRKAGWRHHLVRVVRLIAAIIALGVAVVLMFIPGPAVVFYFISGSLLAAESRGVARGLDWAEIKLRALWGAGRRHWRKLPRWGQATLLAFAACLGAGSAYASYRLLSA